MDDRDIVELYFDRDEKAIAETAQKYGKLCFNIANRIVGDKNDAEECVNDTYLGIWNAIPPQRPGSFPAFVVRIARNLALARLRYRTADKRRSDIFISLNELEDIIPSSDEFEDIDDKEVGRLISEFLLEEKEEYRNIFVRKYWYFDTVEELSEKFGFSESKIKSILFRLRNKLKVYLSEKGVQV